VSVDGKTVEAFREAQTWPKAKAALVLAGAGIPVFPCVAGGKRPLTPRGFLDATTDPGRIGAWWRARPDANIAVPTGAASGLDVVDVDRRENGSGFAVFAAAQGAGVGDRWAMVVATPSGGAHYYYPADPDRPQPSWAGGAAHVDFRGDGGYVVVPPSTGGAPDGAAAPYRIVRTLEHAGPVDAAELRAVVSPRPAAKPAHPARPGKALDGSRLAAWVADRVEGERNACLYWAAGRMAEAGQDMDRAARVLAPAAERAGLPATEVAATIRSAYRHAKQAPASPDSAAGQGLPRRAAGVASSTLRASASGRLGL
jgi:hypothetical protein